MMKDFTERKMVYLDDAIDAIVGCTNCGTEEELRAYSTRHSLENLWTGGIVDALDAIEQLSSAQAKSKELSEWKADFKGYIDALEIPRDDYKGIMEYIDEVPSAQPERPTGEWIVSESEEVGALGVRCRTYTCPSCGWNHSLIISMNFCPNCGNDNRGEQDE